MVKRIWSKLRTIRWWVSKKMDSGISIQGEITYDEWCLSRDKRQYTLICSWKYSYEDYPLNEGRIREVVVFVYKTNTVDNSGNSYLLASNPRDTYRWVCLADIKRIFEECKNKTQIVGSLS